MTRRARVFILGGREAGRTFDLVPSAAELVVGREEDCALRLRDRSISRHHARFELRDGAWMLVDLDSRNGVLSAGKRVDRLRLADGDEVLLGEVPVRFRDLARLEVEEPPALEPTEPRAPTWDGETVRRPRAPDRRPPLALEEEMEIEEEVELVRAPEPRRAPESEPPRVGILRAGLDEQPLWLRSVLVLFLVALAAALAWGVFLGVRALRGGG